ncbi:recombination protein O N-terminal domain-containing protein [Candidatus Gracilibacteria bacterium]|nr:recombination protein O N-terminal domain-containing protein [Candidatus Gracilibacteria bacterium]
MSVFKDKAIVLKVDKIAEKDLLYTIFSCDYGKLKVSKKFSKKEKNIDLGYIINFEIITKENVSIHKIKNVKIKSEFNLENKRTFSEINIFLEILSLIYKESAIGIQNKEIFHLVEEINKKENIDKTKLILAKLKAKAIFGILNIENSDLIISKILKFVFYNKITDIFKLKGITSELEEILEKL